MAISQKLSQMIQDQVGLELRAERFYLQASTVAAHEGFDTFGNFLRIESEYEQWHAKRWTKFSEDLDIIVNAKVTQDNPPANLHDAIRDAMQMEQLLLDHMTEMFYLAFEERCLPVNAFLMTGEKGYEPIREQMKAIQEWEKMLRRLETEDIADVVAAIDH
jgi:ferritin